tara:strand:+ start:196 stop:465 length:270 start_codon:yes stop_codon:yes gene_type:complete
MPFGGQSPLIAQDELHEPISRIATKTPVHIQSLTGGREFTWERVIRHDSVNDRIRQTSPDGDARKSIPVPVPQKFGVDRGTEDQTGNAP